MSTYTARRATGPVQKQSLLQRLSLAWSMKTLPAKYMVILSLVCGAVTVLNQTTFGFPTAVKTSITWGLAIFAFLHVGPTLGPKFRAALKLPPAVANVIGVVMLIGMVVAQQDTALPYRAIIIGAIQIAGGLGFEPAYIPTV